MDFDNKDEKNYSSLSEINKLKRDLIPENFVTIEKNNSMNLQQKHYDINELDKEEQKIDKSNDNNNNNNISNNEENIKNEKSSKKSEEEKEQSDIKEEIKINNEEEEEEKKIEKEEESHPEPKPEKEEEKKEEKILDLIPLWYKCLNKAHQEKYITLDRKKKSLICKNCYMSGALETNLELNQEFIDKYLKEQELRNLSEQMPNVIKETAEENMISESEENPNNANNDNLNNDNKDNKVNQSNESEEENKSKKPSFILKCLTFQCENYPYFFCEPCQDFICYHCIMQKMDERTDKSRHYYHDIESVNYESNSFKDDIKLELDTINKINLSLDYLIKNEKLKNEKIFQKLKTENKSNLINHITNINKKINILCNEDKKALYDKYILNTFNNKDENIKDLQISTNSTKTKVEQALKELKEIKDLINDKKSTNEDKCDLHQKYIDLLKETNLLINKGNNIISQSKEEFNYLNNENIINKYNKEEILSKQIISEKEKSFIQSLTNNSIKQGSFKLNRYVSYRHDGLKFFSSTSVELICQTNSILYGLFLCGKYLSTKKIKQNDYSMIPMEERGFLNINVKIFEKGKEGTLFDENCKLFEVVDVNNPVVDIIFGKGIKMTKDVKYIIVVENLEKENYCDIWVGSVHKKLVSGNKQSIRCNNTGNVFEFYIPQEYHSDFNEFEQGIIEGILYGN